jgi:hypothetical protein
MESTTTKPAVRHSGDGASTQLFEDWFDPIESGVRNQVRQFIEGMIEAELEEGSRTGRDRFVWTAGSETINGRLSRMARSPGAANLVDRACGLAPRCFHRIVTRWSKLTLAIDFPQSS